MNPKDYREALEAYSALKTAEAKKVEDLQHWGIKGQKWGLRRYQNPDGTLTEEGKRHYGRVGESNEYHKGLMAIGRSMQNARDMDRVLALEAELANKYREKGKESKAREHMVSALANANDRYYKSPEDTDKVSKAMDKAYLSGSVPSAVGYSAGLFGGLAVASKTGSVAAALATLLVQPLPAQY